MSEQLQPKENKLGSMPVNKLLISMSLPMIASMLVQALYNVVDSIFVSQISEAALTAVSLNFPIQGFMIAIASGTGVGINALLSKSLGEKNFKEADRAANNGILLSILSSVAFLLFGVFFAGTYYSGQTNDPVIIQHGVTYTSIIAIGSITLFGQVLFERLLQATGIPIYSMVSQLVGAVANIILDPIMIFGLFGFPEMGVAGAAIATVIGRLFGMGVGLYFNLKRNKEIHLSLRGLRPKASTIKKIYAVGLPSIVMQSIGSALIFLFNKILMGFTSTAVAVFGVYFNLQSFVFMPVFGLNNGMIPIISYNYGARRKDRITKTIKMSVILAMSIMLLGFLTFQIFPRQLLSLYSATEDMLHFGVPALRIISINFLFAGYCIVCGTVFQALGKGTYSLIISVLRQLVILLPAAYFLSLTGNVNNVWFSFPIAECAAVVVTTFFLRRIFRTIITPLTERDAERG